MKYLVLSDTHGIYDYMILVPSIVEREKPDQIIFLGDVLYHGYSPNNGEEIVSILRKIMKPMQFIKGNNDTSYDEFELGFPMVISKRIEIDGKIFFFTHGHIYNASNCPNDIDVFVQGHLHYPYIKKDKVIYCNPGSLSLPRKNSKHTYMIINNNEIIIKDIDNNIIEMCTY